MISLNIGVKSNQEYLLELLRDHQPSVTSLQETWLLSYQQPLHYLPEKYDHQIKCLDDDDPVKQTHHSRGSAGTANIWPSNQFTSLIDENHRICSTQPEETGIILFNVYLPLRGRDTNDDFRIEIEIRRQTHSTSRRCQHRYQQKNLVKGIILTKLLKTTWLPRAHPYYWTHIHST